MGEIKNYNNKQELHGYQEWYYGNDDLWIRGTAKHDEPIGYEEIHEHKWSHAQSNPLHTAHQTNACRGARI